MGVIAPLVGRQADTLHQGLDIVGSDAIRAWKEETRARYRITARPIACRVENDETVVVATVRGSFDGSPANLTYRFTLSDDGRVGALEIGS
jgi:hypothetical protein